MENLTASHVALTTCASCVFVTSLVGMFLPLFCVVDLETSNSLIPAAGELMMLNCMLIVSGVEHAMLNIRANLCRGPALSPLRFAILKVP